MPRDGRPACVWPERGEREISVVIKALHLNRDVTGNCCLRALWPVCHFNYLWQTESKAISIHLILSHCRKSCPASAALTNTKWATEVKNNKLKISATLNIFSRHLSPYTCNMFPNYTFIFLNPINSCIFYPKKTPKALINTHLLPIKHKQLSHVVS